MKSLSRILLLTAGLLASACAKSDNDTVTRWSSFPIPLYVSSDFTSVSNSTNVVPLANTAAPADFSGDPSASPLPSPNPSSSPSPTPSPAPALTAMDDLQYAIAFWEQKAGKKLFQLSGDWKGQMPPVNGDISNPQEILGNVIFFPSAWPFDALLGANADGFTKYSYSDDHIDHSVIMLNNSRPFCHGDCQNVFYADSERRVLAHELGHMLGLQHVTDNSNIMYPTALPGGDLTLVTVDQAKLLELTQ